MGQDGEEHRPERPAHPGGLLGLHLAFLRKGLVVRHRGGQPLRRHLHRLRLNAGDAAIFYYWNIYLSDAGGTSHQDFGPSGLLERRSWSGHRTVGGLSPSNGRAWIDSSTSYAALIDGAYCYPGPVTVHYGIN